MRVYWTNTDLRLIEARDEVERLTAENANLRAEVGRLTTENAALWVALPEATADALRTALAGGE